MSYRIAGCCVRLFNHFGREFVFPVELNLVQDDGPIVATLVSLFLYKTAVFAKRQVVLESFDILKAVTTNIDRYSLCIPAR